MAANPDNWNPAQTARDASVSVDLNESDAGKAIERHKADLPGTEDGDAPKRNHFLKEASADVKRRLNRQQRVFDQKRAEDQAEYQRSISRLEKKLDKLAITRAGTVDVDAEHTAKMAALQAQLEAALEEGSSKKVAALQVQITQVDGAYWHAKTTATMLGSQARDPGTKRGTARTREPDPDDEDEDEDDPASRQRPAAKGAPSVAASAWREANKDWYLDVDEFAGEIAYANTLYQRAREDGEADSPELFARLSRTLKKRFPDVDVQVPRSKRAAEFADDDRDEPAARRGRSPVVNIDRGDEDDSPRRGRVRLDNDDLKAMTSFGLDNTNPEHLRRWAAEKANTAAEA